MRFIKRKHASVWNLVSVVVLLAWAVAGFLQLGDAEGRNKDWFCLESDLMSDNRATCDALCPDDVCIAKSEFYSSLRIVIAISLALALTSPLAWACGACGDCHSFISLWDAAMVLMFLAMFAFGAQSDSGRLSHEEMFYVWMAASGLVVLVSAVAIASKVAKPEPSSYEMIEEGSSFVHASEGRIQNETRHPSLY